VAERRNLPFIGAFDSEISRLKGFRAKNTLFMGNSIHQYFHEANASSIACQRIFSHLECHLKVENSAFHEKKR